MSVKLPIYKLLIFLIDLAIIIDYHFFYLFHYNSFFNLLLAGHKTQITLSLITLLCCIICLSKYKKDLKNNLSKIYLILILYLLAFLVEICYSYLSYDQPFSSVLGYGARLLLIFLYIPILTILIREKKRDEFLNSVEVILFIWEVILILQSVSYSSSGRLLFAFDDFYYNDIKVRNNNLRAGLGGVGNLLLVINFYKVYFKKAKNKYWWQYLFFLIIGLYCLFFIQQTRMWTLAVLLSIFTLIITKGGSLKGQAIKILLIIFVTIIFTTNNTFTTLLSQLSINGSDEYAWSAKGHLFSFSYNWKCFKKRPLFGNGFLSEINYYQLIHGTPKGALFTSDYSDAGFVGLLGETGLMSFWFFVIPFLYCVKDFLFVRKRIGKGNDCALLISLVVFIAITSISLILTSQGNVLAFAIIIAIFDYYKIYFEKSDFDKIQDA